MKTRALALDDLKEAQAVEADARARFDGLSVAFPQVDRTHELVQAMQDGLAFGFEENGLQGVIYGSVAGESLLLESVAVRLAGERRGIGAVLMERFFQAGAELGLSSVVVTAFADVRFHAPYLERLGFVRGAGPRGAALLSFEATRGFVESERVAMTRPLEPTPGTVIEAFTTEEAAPDVLVEVRGLLDRAFPGRFTDADWDHALGGLHVVVRTDGVLVAHASAVPRTLFVGSERRDAGYFESVAVEPKLQGKGLGTQVMRALTVRVRDRRDMLALCTGSSGFYARLGWQVWAGSSFVVRGSGLELSPEEDGNILVLEGLRPLPPLDGLLGCEERSGDDW